MAGCDPFNLAALRVDPPDSRLRRKPNRWRRQYVRLPWSWVERLQGARRVSTYRVALLAAYEHWRSGGRPLVLSNVLSEAEGLSRRSKWNAVAELERLGLVRVERRAGRSPRLTLLHMDREPT